MHRAFRKLLEKARGVSDFVVALNLDIRGFSDFSKKVESPNTAMYVKRVYVRLIDEYFDYASFFKPTGDGLLVIIKYKESDLQKIVRKTIDSCVKVVGDFDSFCANDPMINFNVPERIGIGIARGTACRLVSGNVILDYSGRVLNLASRLMDIARPSGIVFDSNFGIELLSDEQIKLFDRDSIYLRGISEEETLDIFYSKKWTEIQVINKQPLTKVKWEEISDIKTLKKIKDCYPTFQYRLSSEPSNEKDIKVRVEHIAVIRGKKRTDIQTIVDFTDFKYTLDAGRPVIDMNYGKLAERLVKNGVKDSYKVHIRIRYTQK
jgi:class 3 adenylate cyclase